MGNLAAGWYDDGSGQQRWWDGQAWTEHIQQPNTESPVFAGRYSLIGEIGRGSFGVVYLATDTRTGGNVAVKMFTQITPDTRASVGREAGALLAVRSENCLQVVDVIDTPDALALVTDYVPGATLRELLDSHGALSGPEAAQVLWGAATGLGAVHAAGLVHGDVKPANILITPTGVSKLIDFGLVGLPGIGSADGSVSGSPAYAAPEQMLNGVRDARSDIYALSVTLFEVLCQQRPFAAATSDELVQAHAYAPIPDPRQFAPALSPVLAELVMSGLAKNPAYRPASVGEFLRRFEEGARETWGAGWLTAGGLAGVASGVVGALEGGGSPTVAVAGQVAQATGRRAGRSASKAMAKKAGAATGKAALAAKVTAGVVAVAAIGTAGTIALAHGSSKKAVVAGQVQPAIEAVAWQSTSASPNSLSKLLAIRNDGTIVPLANSGSYGDRGMVRYSPDGRWVVSDQVAHNSPTTYEPDQFMLTIASTQNPAKKSQLECSCSGFAFDSAGRLVTVDPGGSTISTYDISSGSARLITSTNLAGVQTFMAPYAARVAQESSGTNASGLWSLFGVADGSALVFVYGVGGSEAAGSPGWAKVDLQSGQVTAIGQASRGAEFNASSADGRQIFVTEFGGGTDTGIFSGGEAIDVPTTMADPSGHIHGSAWTQFGPVVPIVDGNSFTSAIGGPNANDGGDPSLFTSLFSWQNCTIGASASPMASPTCSPNGALAAGLKTHDDKNLSESLPPLRGEWTQPWLGNLSLDGKHVLSDVIAVYLAPTIGPVNSAASSTAPSPTPTSPSATPTRTVGYYSYRNARFGFTVQVPTTFTAGGPADNGDGLNWKSPDGKTNFGASASNNVSGDTAASQLQFCRQSVMGGGGRVTYSYSDSKVWACSGFAADGSIFYDWGRVETNVEYNLAWNYPAADKSTYGPMVTHTVNTFRPGPNRPA